MQRNLKRNNHLVNSRNRSRARKSNKNDRTINSIPFNLKTPSVLQIPFVDYQLSGSSTTSVGASSILLSMFNVLAQYPQHSSGNFVSGGAGYGLRQRLFLEFIEMRITFTGSQATVLAAADLYNSIRYALVRTGPPFSHTVSPYLQGMNVGTVIEDVEHVYEDKTIPLPTQAFDTVNMYNVPQVITIAKKVPLNLPIDWFTSDPTGTTGWDTRSKNLYFNHVSDSSLTPHPFIDACFRIFFRFV